ncbi:MAG: response regulator [Gammaproteobacteria bacterium]|nr:response regulator [Gammaproteobacteria bacterium]
MLALGSRRATAAVPSSAAVPAVLVVQSNPVARDRICALLQAAALEVTVCDTAEHALDALAGGEFQAMVIDYMLDDMSGFSLLQAARAAGRVPAVVMTAGRAEVSAAVRAVREGIVDFLPGPADGRLVQALRKVLKHRV